MDNTTLALVSIALILTGAAWIWATREAPIDELRCEGRGITIDTTMTELRKPGPYVVGIQPDGDTIAVAKDGLRCQRLD